MQLMNQAFKILTVFNVFALFFTGAVFADGYTPSDPTNPIIPGIGTGGITIPTLYDCSAAGQYRNCGGGNGTLSVVSCVCATCPAGSYCPSGQQTAETCPTKFPVSDAGAQTINNCYVPIYFHPNATTGTSPVVYNDKSYTTTTEYLDTIYKAYYKTSASAQASCYISSKSYCKVNKDGTRFITEFPSGLTRKGYSAVTPFWNTKSDMSGSYAYLNNGLEYTIKNLYARWRLDTHTITYNLGGGTCTNCSKPAYTSYTVESADIALPTPTKTGYSFTGWKDSNGNSVTKVEKGSTGNKTLTATWKANTIGLSWNSGDLNVSITNAPSNCTYGETFTVPSLTASGYTFDGWLKGSSDKILSAGPQTCNKTKLGIASGNLSLTAKWIAHRYTVEFHSNYGQDSTVTQNMTYGTSTQLDQNQFTRDGYSFKNWCINPACSTSLTFNDNANVSNLTTDDNGTVRLYANWEPDKAIIGLNYNGGTGAQQTNLYTIFEDGVYLDANRTRKMTTSENPITVPAGPSNTIAYDKNTDDHVTISGDYTTEFKQTFDGFYSIIDNEAYTLINSGGFIESDGISLGTSYTSSDNPEWGALYGRTTVTLPTNVTRTGYTFNGWCTSQTCATPYNGTAQLLHNTTLYAQWEPITYTIIFNKNNTDASGEIDDMTDVKYNEPVTLPTSGFTLDGYFLSGWCTTSTCSGDDNTTYTLGYSVKNLLSEALTITLYAKWTTTQGCRAGQYFNAADNECKDCPDGSYCKGCDEVTTLDANCGIKTCPPGYTSDAKAEKLSDCYTSDTTSCAVVNPFTPTHVTNWSYNETGAVNCKKYCDWDEDNAECKADAPCMPNDSTACNINTGTFACVDGYTTNIENVVSPTCDIVTKHITYHLDGGKLSGSVQYTFDSTNGTATQGYNVESGDITLPTSQHVTKKGYTFGGWYDNASLTGDIVTSVPHGSYSNKDFYAKWTATPYTITYNTNDGTCAECSNSAYTSYTIESSDVTLPTNVTKDGYTFGGWKDTSGTIVNKIVSGSTIGDKIFNATWVSDGYTVTFKCDDNITRQTSINYDAYFTMNFYANEVCALDGYDIADNFVCKKDSDNTLVTLSSGFWNIASDVTCSATRTANEYTIDYYCGSDFNRSDTVTFNTSYTLQDLDICTKPGFTLSENWSCKDATTDAPVDLSESTWQYPNDIKCINDITQNVALCPAGTYLPSDHDQTEDCVICESDSFCPGYTYYGDSGFMLSDEDQGIESCPDGKRSPAGAKSFWDCGYIMHVNGDELYLSQKKQSGKPALAVKWGENTAYATMSPVPPSNRSLAKPITSGSNVKLHVKYKNVEYTVHDNTVE